MSDILQTIRPQIHAAIAKAGGATTRDIVRELDPVRTWAVRTALTKMAADGYVLVDRTGRKGIWRLGSKPLPAAEAVAEAVDDADTGEQRLVVREAGTIPAEVIARMGLAGIARQMGMLP
jgi:DNA-binding transcriptional regulator PaaX